MTLSALKTINTGTVMLETDGASSVLNVPALTSFTETGGWTTRPCKPPTAARSTIASWPRLSNVTLNVGDGRGSAPSHLTSFTSGENVTVTAGGRSAYRG